MVGYWNVTGWFVKFQSTVKRKSEPGFSNACSHFSDLPGSTRDVGNVERSPSNTAFDSASPDVARRSVLDASTGAEDPFVNVTSTATKFFTLLSMTAATDDGWNGFGSEIRIFTPSGHVASCPKADAPCAVVVASAAVVVASAAVVASTAGEAVCVACSPGSETVGPC